MTDDDLNRLVEEYASIGAHRTGTDDDAATRGWLRSVLTEHGAAPDEVGYRFPRFLARHHRVTIDGVEVESEPLWYAGTGPWETTDVARWTTSADDPVLEDGGETPVVVATLGTHGHLRLPNRSPEGAVERPHALIPGDLADRLPEGVIRYEAELTVVEGGSANVEAWFTHPAAHPVLVVTPVTGWFACAGERGTGIAIAIAIASELAQRHPVKLVGTTGHEIGYLGARELVRGWTGSPPRAVIHVGASVGAGNRTEHGLEFDPRRFVMTTATSPATEAIAEAVAIAGYPSVTSAPEDWVGEGVELQRLGAPMLSYLGLFDRFHTPADVPAAVTSPALLSAAWAGVRDGTDVFLDHAVRTGAVA